jgi:hypothetical protein
VQARTVLAMLDLVVSKRCADCAGGKPSIELPSGEDFFNQHEHDNPEGFFDSLPDHPTPPADYTPSGMSAGGLDPNRRASSLGGAAANGITGEPSTPMGMDPNHIPEGAERVSTVWGSTRGWGLSFFKP